MPRTFISTHDGVRRGSLVVDKDWLHGTPLELKRVRRVCNRDRETGVILDQYIKEYWFCGCTSRVPWDFKDYIMLAAKTAHYSPTSQSKYKPHPRRSRWDSWADEASE